MTDQQAYAVIFQWVGIVIVLVCYLAARMLGERQRKKRQAKRNAELDRLIARMPEVQREQLDAYARNFGK